LWLFPGVKVPALDLVVTDKFGIGPLCPTPRGWTEPVRKDGNRDGGAFDIEIREPILSTKTDRRKGGTHV
jgi:hypothetical protein